MSSEGGLVGSDKMMHWNILIGGWDIRNQLMCAQMHAIPQLPRLLRSYPLISCQWLEWDIEVREWIIGKHYLSFYFCVDATRGISWSLGLQDSLTWPFMFKKLVAYLICSEYIRSVCRMMLHERQQLCRELFPSCHLNLLKKHIWKRLQSTACF